MSVHTYRENRQQIEPEELARHRGKWVAFSPDGVRIIDSDAKFAGLEERLTATGQDPQHVVYEYVDEDDIVLGGAEVL